MGLRWWASIMTRWNAYGTIKTQYSDCSVWEPAQVPDIVVGITM